MTFRMIAAASVAAFCFSGVVHAHPNDLDTWEQYRAAKLAPQFKTPIEPESFSAAMAARRRLRAIARLHSRWVKFDAAYWASLKPDEVEPAHAEHSIPDWSVGPFAIPTYIVLCESGGNYLAENDYSTASGAYQIIDSSWGGFGGYSHASYAPPSVQDAKAALMWAGGAGAHHWAACL